MSDTVIKIENLSKQYRLSHVSTGTISHDLDLGEAEVIFASIELKADIVVQL